MKNFDFALGVSLLAGIVIFLLQQATSFFKNKSNSKDAYFIKRFIEGDIKIPGVGPKTLNKIKKEFNNFQKKK